MVAMIVAVGVGKEFEYLCHKLLNLNPNQPKGFFRLQIWHERKHYYS